MEDKTFFDISYRKADGSRESFRIAADSYEVDGDVAHFYHKKECIGSFLDWEYVCKVFPVPEAKKPDAIVVD